ncbi:syntaxin-like [Gigantopelta aegis]|uniref:syntaxin-like n=1 Tax=Gigantopelta aegis TaxID=1735272 RepID=UPI001B88DD14|nr:syntaxin-like [Gigantopelta aegis]
MCASGVRDRLAEMQMMQKESGSVAKKKKGKTSSDSEEDVQKVLARVSRIEKSLKDVEQQTATMVKLQCDILNNPFCDKKQVLLCDRTISDIQTNLQLVRGDVRKLEDENLQNQNSGLVDTAVARVKEQQVNRLTTELAKATNRFYKGQADYMDKMKQRVKKQLAVTGCHGNMSESEVSEILDNDSYAIFTQNFISDVTNTETALREIEERQKEILSLEKSVVQVNELFRDMNILVVEQGETIDSIEANIVDASENIVDANVQLKRANTYQAKARRLKFCIAGIVIAVIVIIILIVVLSLYA